uniref:G-protein coupled receptors family 1 profile domain-containing protein n=1 Tax=Plectus sambesii TaxID=2011161 RepID=A0A914VJC6_9BILA
MYVDGILPDGLCLISIPFYLLLMVACVKFRHQEPFSSSFFVLTFSQGMADLLMIVTLFLLLKPPICYGLFTDVYLSHPLILGQLQAFFSMGICSLQHISLLLIALNRFTAVCIPMRHNKIWKRSTITVVIILQWSIPTLLYAPIFSFDVQFVEIANSSKLGLSYGNQQVLSIYYTIGFVTILTTVIACSVLYALQFLVMWKQRSRSGVISSEARIEFRMAIMGAIIFVISSCYLFFLITSIVAPSILQTAFDLVWLYFLATAIMSSVNPFIIIGMSKKVRTACFGLIYTFYASDRDAPLNSSRIRSSELMNAK